MGTLVAFGAGANFYPLVERIDQARRIAAFCDNNSRKWGQHLMGDERICIRPDDLQKMDAPFVLVMSERENSRKAIERQCDQYNIPHKRAYDFLEELHPDAPKCQWPQQIQNYRIHKFIELLVHGTTECNFHCEYCYVWRKNEFTKGRMTSEYSAREIRRALSKKRMGGSCHINACALGETLLSQDIVELTYELLEEGHYVSIVTNGTIVPKIDAMLKFPDELLARLFFKLSFHYAELNRTNLYEIFWENVDKIKNSPCSYSIEITPCDSLIRNINDIKAEFEERAGGAMPHITFTRDANKEGLDLLSDLTLEEYRNIWGSFDSDLFALKSSLYKQKISQSCYAGNWSYRINTVNGNLQGCYQQELKGTIFDDIDRPLPVLTVKHNCNMDYCFNNHAFLAWGDVPEIMCDTYYRVRNRVEKDSKYWVKEPYAAVMKQKLYDNNFEYIDRWSDYEKLFREDRKSALILFNSPDYGNLGDHAIAVAERKLFGELFPDTEFIEISCEQYIRENLLIQNAIKESDILLLSGGGYLGSLWLWLEDITKNIIRHYKNNKIIILPQTLYFAENSLGESEKNSLAATLNQHSDLTILLRDLSSLGLADKIFSDSVKKMPVPDMAFLLPTQKSVNRRGCLVCIRDDKESMGIDFHDVSRVLADMGLEAECFNTVSEEAVYLDNRNERVRRLLDQISGAQIVVTDRLHGMILCAVTDTPCIAFDNVSGKVSETYQWLLREHPYILLCEDMGKLRENMENLLHRMETLRSDNIMKSIHGRFDGLKKYLKENCVI